MPATGRHAVDGTPPSSLPRQLATAGAFVVIVALVFWGVGKIRGDGGGVTVLPSPTVSPTSVVPTEPVTPTGPTSPLPTETGPVATGTPTDGPTGPPGPTETSAAADISIQILDGVRDDGGARAAAFATRLEEGGYDIVARDNSTIRDYADTTAFFTPGHENDARQLAQQFPEITVVSPAPDNLNAEVDVHIVVGDNYPAA